MASLTHHHHPAAAHHHRHPQPQHGSSASFSGIHLHHKLDLNSSSAVAGHLHHHPLHGHQHQHPLVYAPLLPTLPNESALPKIPSFVEPTENASALLRVHQSADNNMHAAAIRNHSFEQLAAAAFVAAGNLLAPSLPHAAPPTILDIVGIGGQYSQQQSGIGIGTNAMAVAEFGQGQQEADEAKMVATAAMECSPPQPSFGSRLSSGSSSGQDSDGCRSCSSCPLNIATKQFKVDSSISAVQSKNDEQVAEQQKGNAEAPKGKKPLVRDEAYWERRRKNNDAAKRSRDSRRKKEDEIAVRAVILEQENLRLRFELERLRTEIERHRIVAYSQGIVQQQTQQGLTTEAVDKLMEGQQHHSQPIAASLSALLSSAAVTGHNHPMALAALAAMANVQQQVFTMPSKTLLPTETIQQKSSQQQQQPSPASSNV